MRSLLVVGAGQPVEDLGVVLGQAGGVHGTDGTTHDLDLDAGPVHDRLAQNIATAIVPAPLFLGQGVDDEVVSIDIQRTDARVCAAGRPVETHEYPGRDHMGVIAQGSPLIDDLFVWADRVTAGEAPSTCS